MAASNFVTDFFKNVLVNLKKDFFSHKNLNLKKLQVQTACPLSCVNCSTLSVKRCGTYAPHIENLFFPDPIWTLTFNTENTLFLTEIYLFPTNKQTNTLLVTNRRTPPFSLRLRSSSSSIRKSAQYRPIIHDWAAACLLPRYKKWKPRVYSKIVNKQDGVCVLAWRWLHTCVVY